MNLTAVGIDQTEHYLFTPLLGENNSIVQATTLIKKGEEVAIGRHRFIIYGTMVPNQRLVVNLFDWPANFSLPEIMVGPIDIDLLKYRVDIINKGIETIAELWGTTPQALIEMILLISPTKNSEYEN